MPADGALGSRQEKPVGGREALLSGPQECVGGYGLLRRVTPLSSRERMKDWIAGGTTLEQAGLEGYSAQHGQHS